LKATGVYVIEDVDHFNEQDYTGMRDRLSIHTDKSRQSLVVLRPLASLAGELPATAT
jgi:hypothetical protein